MEIGIDDPLALREYTTVRKRALLKKNREEGRKVRFDKSSISVCVLG